MREEKALFIIFGGTGDLAQRKLYPALFNLYRRGHIQKSFAVIGTARRPWTDEHYREVVADSIRGSVDADFYTEAMVENFADHFYYQSHNVNDTEHYMILKKLAQQLDDEYEIGGNRVFYLAMSPRFFGTIAEHLKTQRLVTDHGYNRVVVEKPFGRDLATATELNQSIEKYFPADSIFRIDHYLGKAMIQNITAIRFGNSIFRNLWNNRYIDNIQITLSESLGVEERAGYYETAGALRDMVQNHILQIVSLLTMNAPVSFNDRDLRQEKISALKSLKVYTPDEVAHNFVRGQYGPGEGVHAYRDEDNIADDSAIETFVAGKLEVENMNFAGVPVYIRTGKRLATKATRIDVIFKKMPTNIFPGVALTNNVLSIDVDPNEEITLYINDKDYDTGFKMKQLPLAYRNQNRDCPEAYEKLLHDLLRGDATNFTHWEEVKYSWQFVDAIRSAWDMETPSFPNYESGSMGPQAADELLARDGKQWFFDPTKTN